MRILQICSAREIGGGERYLADLTNSLVERGHDIFAALTPNSLLINELNLARENILFSRLRNALDVFSAFELANFIREKKIEIIHAHLGRDYNLAATASRLTKTPFVLTRHVLFKLNRLHKFSLNRVSGVIAPSNAIADSLKKQLLFPPEKITVIRYGINLEHFAPEITKKDENFVVGTIGHLAPIKGHDTFVKAAAAVLKKRKDVRFLIIGEDKSTSGKNRSEIEDLIKKFELQKNVEMVGWTDDVRQYLRRFDIFVSAAREEAFGIVMIEAMMFGLPVVATESEGAREIIEDDKSGILIPIEDERAMANAILSLLDNESERKRLAENGQKRVVENFSLDKMVSDTEKFYRRVLAQTPAR
jgi:L-malate glycosyltransferase